MRGQIIVAGALLLGGCASNVISQSKSPTLPEEIELGDTPFYAQEAYQCGPAALATVLGASGVDATPDALVEKVYVPGRKGSYQIELISATRSFGRLPYVIEPELGAVLNELSAGHPVLVFQNLGNSLLPFWHYAVVIGYSAGDDHFILRSGTTKRQIMSASRFSKSWQRGKNWAMLVLAPGQLPLSDDVLRYLESVAAAEAAGDVGIAIDGYLAALKRWPDNGTAMFGLGNVYYRIGNYSKSAEMFRRVIDTEPGHVAALNNLASLLAKQGQCVVAQSLIKQAEQQSLTSSALQAAVAQTRAEIRTCQ